MSARTLPEIPWRAHTLAVIARAYGIVTTPDGAVWCRMCPREQLGLEADVLEPRLHEIPVLGYPTE